MNDANGPVGAPKNGTGGRETGAGPAPGVAMLACACGTVLVDGDMVRAPSFVPRAELASGSPISRIVCGECAAALVQEDVS